MAASAALAFALRAHRLAGQSLWSDEDITADRVALPLADLVARLPVEHGPSYFVLVRGWTVLSRASDFDLRWPSLLFGVLAVPLAAYVGARLIGRGAAVVLAAVTAFSPFLVWYGQEARMYAMVGALALLALACVLRAESSAGLAAGGRPSLRSAVWWVAAGAAAALTVTTHYYGALIVFVLAAWCALDLARGGRRNAAGWALAAITAALCFAPWLARAIDALGFGGWREPVALSRVPWILASAWSAGVTADVGQARWIAALYIALAVLGLLVTSRRAVRGPGRVGAGRALIYALVPLAVAAALLARDPDFHPRYFLPVVPAVYLLVAAGAASLPALAAAAATGALFLAAVGPLENLYTDSAHQKPDIHAAVDLVEAATGPVGAALLLDGPPFGIVDRYRAEDSSVRVVNLQSSSLEGLDDDALDAAIRERVQPYDTGWLLSDGQTSGRGRDWLDRFAYPVLDESLRDLTLSRYALPAGPDMAILDAEPMGAPSGIELQTAAAEFGGVVRVVLLWHVIELPDRWADHEHKVAVRLVDEEGRIIASADRRPVNWRSPTSDWSPGDLIDDRHGLALPAGAPPGAYSLEVVLYDEASLAPIGTWRARSTVVVDHEGGA